jgi:glycosyltransferase involved in cell wall biosynthesis
MNVLLVPADESACRLYRLQGPADAVRERLGLDVEVAPAAIPKRSPMTGELPPEVSPGDADVVVLHRPAFKGIVDLIPKLQAQDRAVVVDIDDDLSVPHPEHSWSRPKLHLDPAQQARACELADLVTCTTPALAEHYGAHGRVKILPNYVPEALLRLERASDGSTLGWAGSASGHPGDLPVTDGGVDDALLDCAGWHFKVIGPVETVRRELDLSEDPDATGGLSIEDYQAAIGTLDVGIVPLASTAFNAAKSGLKGLEYAARGVPFVASPLPEYQKLAKEGVGVLAATPLDWWHRLRELMTDEKRRRAHAERAYEKVRESHTYERNAAKWVYAWEQAIQNRKGSKP